MNFIAAVFLLLGFDEWVTLQGLIYFVEEICPGYHTPEMQGFKQDMSVLEILMQRLMPWMYQHFVGLDVPLAVLALTHFITLGSRECRCRRWRSSGTWSWR